jgi:hypothetical protein
MDSQVKEFVWDLETKQWVPYVPTAALTMNEQILKYAAETKDQFYAGMTEVLKSTGWDTHGRGYLAEEVEKIK